MKTVHHSVRLAGRPQRLEVDFIRTLMLNWISINKLGLGLTIFAWSDAAATHRARNFVRLLAAFIKLSVIGKIFRNCKGFEKSQFYKITKNCDAVTWFWSKPSSLISRRALCYKAYLRGTSNQFPRFLPMISHNDRPPCLKKTSLDSMRSCVYRVYSFDIAVRDPRFLHVRMCNSIIAAASIRERWLFRSARPVVRRQIESRVWSSKYGMYN